MRELWRSDRRRPVLLGMRTAHDDLVPAALTALEHYGVIGINWNARLGLIVRDVTLRCRGDRFVFLSRVYGEKAAVVIDLVIVELPLDRPIVSRCSGNSRCRSSRGCFAKREMTPDFRFVQTRQEAMVVRRQKSYAIGIERKHDDFARICNSRGSDRDEHVAIAVRSGNR